jgi:hypothetical protein
MEQKEKPNKYIDGFAKHMKGYEKSGEFPIAGIILMANKDGNETGTAAVVWTEAQRYALIKACKIEEEYNKLDIQQAAMEHYLKDHKGEMDKFAKTAKQMADAISDYNKVHGNYIG